MPQPEHRLPAPPESVRRRLRTIIQSLRNATAGSRGAEALARIKSRAERHELAVLLADNYGSLIGVNQAAVNLLGYTRSKLCRLSVWDLTPEATESEFDVLWRSFRRSRFQCGVYAVSTSKGRVRRTFYFAEPNVLPGVHVSVLQPIPSSRTAGRIPTRARKRRSVRHVT